MAREHGLQDQCRFPFMDMDRLEFGDQTFDAVFNQESFCYSSDKRRYLASVHRVLRPGGTWRAVAFSVQPGPLSPRQAEQYEAVRDGFKLASMLPAVEIESLMNLAGFVGTRAIDITSAVLPTARTMIRTCGVPRWLMRLHLDWLIFSREARRRAHLQGHYRQVRPIRWGSSSDTSVTISTRAVALDGSGPASVSLVPASGGPDSPGQRRRKCKRF